MGRLSEAIALANMTKKDRARYAYGVKSEAYFCYLNVDKKLLKEITPKRDETEISITHCKRLRKS